ncbi:hypothetical protein [Paenibacillus sp. NPDC057967]|uniref:hypothetical protein n=1 Tax=Paenibacillus sp. NPDC057967 TaxID=3346293 RepID=UPI0036DEF538
MSNRVKLSQQTAILLERARRFGVSEEELLSCAVTGDTTSLQVAEAQYYSYDEFVSYAHEHNERLEDAIRFGYRIKFSTPGGVQLWLKERFGLEAGVDFTASPGLIEQVKLSEGQLQLLNATIAGNWAFLEGSVVLDREVLLAGDESAAVLKEASASSEAPGNDAAKSRQLTLVIRSELESYLSSLGA